MLHESDVICAVCAYLERQDYKIQDYKILQKLTETENGDDVIAIDSFGRKFFIEAKGETSSKENSARYGRAFSSSQVGVHVFY